MGVISRDVKASRSARPRGQIMWPRPHNGWPRPHLVVASCILASWPQIFFALCTEPDKLATTSIEGYFGPEPPAKKQRTSLFGHYSVSSVQSTSSAARDKTPARVLADYIETINTTDMQLCDVFTSSQYCSIRQLLERVLCVPASSAPVERVFSQSGLVMKPNRARMSDALLEELVFLKCNDCV